MSAIVERVSNVLPHAHFTVAVAYSGWISVFIGGPAWRDVQFRKQLGNIPGTKAKRQADNGLLVCHHPSGPIRYPDCPVWVPEDPTLMTAKTADFLASVPMFSGL